MTLSTVKGIFAAASLVAVKSIILYKTNGCVISEAHATLRKAS